VGIEGRLEACGRSTEHRGHTSASGQAGDGKRISATRTEASVVRHCAWLTAALLTSMFRGGHAGRSVRPQNVAEMLDMTVTACWPFEDARAWRGGGHRDYTRRRGRWRCSSTSFILGAVLTCGRFGRFNCHNPVGYEAQWAPKPAPVGT
jgi:hypothetical protein